MLQLNWSNSLSSKERNLTLPSPLQLHSPSSSLVQAPGSGSCHLLCQAWQEPASFSAVLGWWQAGFFRTYGAMLWPSHPEHNIWNTLSLNYLALNPVSFSKPSWKCIGGLLQVSPNLHKTEKIGGPVFNMDEMCMLEMILPCVWCSALVQVLHAVER